MPAKLFLVGTFLVSTLSAAGQSSAPPQVSARALAIHNSSIVVDTHADTPQRFLDENFDIGNSDRKDVGHVTL
ncbi:MAG: membrane dipeptidase, partial [Acidobacteria bacterium]